MFDFVGTFKVTGNEIRVSDPCYSKDTSCVEVLRDVIPGKYNAYIDILDRGCWGKRVSSLTICHSDYKYYEVSYNSIGNVIGVDSGQAGFYDESFYPEGESTGEFDDKNTFYGKVCELTLSGFMGGIVDNFGVVSSSGFGDGCYELFTLKNRKGEIVGAMIDFGVDSDDGEDEDEDDEYFW